MRFALPIQKDRVSPVFDTCTKVLVVTAEGGKETGRDEISFENTNRFERASRLKELKVEVLLCGAVSRMVWAQLENMGIVVFPWIAGPIDEVVKAFLEDKLPTPELTLPGCWGFGRKGWFRRGWGKGRWGPGPWF